MGEPMDPLDTGQETTEKQSPAAANGTPSETLYPERRQRKRNVRYADYETEDKFLSNSFQDKASAGSPQVKGATPAKTPKRRRRPPNAARGRKASKKTPARKNTAKDKAAVGDGVQQENNQAAVGDGVQQENNQAAVGDGVQQENNQAAAGDGVQQETGTPKPKRKYVKRQRLQLDPVTEPAPEPEEETEPGGRRRRGAARAALKYLRAFAQEVFGHAGDEVDGAGGADADSQKKSPVDRQARKGRKTKRLDSDAADDLDFVPEGEEEELNADEEEEEEEEEEDLESDFTSRRRTSAAHQSNTSYRNSSNGFSVSFMRSTWDSAETTRNYRQQHHSSWEFPDWIPSSPDWTPVPQSVVEDYLPQELQSAAFTVSREGLKKEDTPSQRLRRFEALPPHPLRWDTALFVGGPVWALEWCPAPDGAPATQYLAVACHSRMEDRHHANLTYTGPALVQLWDVGKLEYKKQPDRRPAFSYGLAHDDGFIWKLKWCPAGCWEPPGSAHKPPLLSRLGLLAVVSSSGVLSVYSLPHPDVLLQNVSLSDSGRDSPAVFKARPAVRLKLGSLRAPRLQRSGMVLSVDWLPQKPHNVIAVGFYDGIVGLWDLNTKSALLRVRDSTESISLLPYRCFLAHHNAVRVLSFCPASRFLLVTAGDDHSVKTWDLRRLWDPVTVQRRQLVNDVVWLLKSPRLLMVQDSAFAPKTSSGLHFIDYTFRPVTLIPRTANVWSVSYSEWLHSVVTADCLGELILSLLPQLDFAQQHFRRLLERRFPVSLSSLVPHQTSGGDDDEEEEEEGGDGERPSSGGGTQQDQGPGPGSHFQTYRESVKKYLIHHEDNNMLTFAGSEKRTVWKRMRDTETTSKVNLDELPLAALHKVQFSPNLTSHPWLAAAGQSGIVRLHCLRSLTSPHVEELILQNQGCLTGLDSQQDQNQNQDQDQVQVQDQDQEQQES